jgi:hypothetical protein
MKVKELLEILMFVNPEAVVDVIVQNYPRKFSLAQGGAEGCTNETCDSFAFYVDDMCTSEKTQ